MKLDEEYIYIWVRGEGLGLRDISEVKPTGSAVSQRGE